MAKNGMLVKAVADGLVGQVLPDHYIYFSR